jgi:TolB-like protein/class 3 adenylate cyclase/rhodanese-related sulfurtransferase
MERRLAAILVTDVVGYSRLIRADEEGTIAALKALRADLIDPKIAEHNGRIVKLMGDGMLAEFASVVDAVRTAVEIQAVVAKHNAGLPEDKRIEFRVGVNLGDVVIDGDDIYGDGVNVAARLEGLAEPGGICVSDKVYEEVRDRTDLAFEDLGEQEVKNIDRPVRVFRVLLDGEVSTSPRVPTARLKPAKPWPAVAAVVLVTAIAGGGAWWWQSQQPDFTPVDPAKMALPLPDKPSIAILPFDNLSADPEQTYFADGMTDDLITGLSKLSGLFVISRNTTFTYKGKPVKVRQVAEELGVRYVLEGSVRRAGDQVRINAQLIDALSGFHLWAEKYDGAFADIFALQDKVVGQIVTAMAVNLTSAESAQKGQAETAVPQAYDALLQGWDHYRRQTPEDYAKAISFFEKAIELDPDYSRAYAGLAGVYWNVYDFGWGVHLGIEYQTIDRAKQNLAKALEQPTSDAYAVSADMLIGQGRNDEALAEIDRAIVLAPNGAGNYTSRAWILNALGRAEEAEDDARLAIRLDPSRHSNLRALGRALFYQKRYEEAAETLERAVSRLPDYEFTYRNLAATYGHLGRIEDAKAAVEKYNEIVAKTIGSPLTLQSVKTFFGGGWYDIDKTYLAQLVEGLRKAGVPEGATVKTVAVDYRDLVSRSAGTFDVEGAVKIDAAGAKALSDRGVVFIDSRSNGPYSRGHIPNAINLFTTTNLTEEILSELVDPDDEVVFYCGGEDCPLSANACAKALVWGYTKVYYFAAGYPGWKDAGYQVETP